MLGELAGLNNIKLEPLKNFDAVQLVKNLPKINSYVEINVLEKINDMYKVLIDGKLFQANLDVKLYANDSVLAKVIAQQPFTVSLDNLVPAKNLNDGVIAMFLNKLNLPQTDNAVKALLAFVKADKPLVKEKIMRLIEVLESADFEDADLDTSLEVIVKILSSSEDRSPVLSKAFVKNFQKPIDKLITETFEAVKNLKKENLPKEIVEQLNNALIFDAEELDPETFIKFIKGKPEDIKELIKVITEKLAERELIKGKLPEGKKTEGNPAWKEPTDEKLTLKEAVVLKNLKELLVNIEKAVIKGTFTKREEPELKSLLKNFKEFTQTNSEQSKEGFPKEVLEKVNNTLLLSQEKGIPAKLLAALKNGDNGIKEFTKAITEELAKGNLPKQEAAELKNIKELLDNFSYQKTFYEKMGLSPQFLILKDGEKYRLAEYNIERSTNGKGKEVFKINLRMNPENLGQVHINGAMMENSLSARFYAAKEASKKIESEFNGLIETLQSKLNVSANFSSGDLNGDNGNDKKPYGFSKSIDVKA